MNIHNLPKGYCLVDAASFNGNIMTDRDEWEDGHPKDEHLYTVWLSLRERDEAIDKRWASFATFAAEAVTLEVYVGMGRELDCTYKGAKVLSSQTCVWSPVRYELASIREGDEIYFDETHYFQTHGRFGGEQSKLLLRRVV